MREEDAPATTGTKPTFPSDNVAQTAAVLSALAAASGPIDGPAIAAGFRQGRRIAAQVAAVLATLARMGFVGTSGGGRTFSLRRVA